MDKEFSQITVPSGAYKVKDAAGRKNLQDYETSNNAAVQSVTQTANTNKTNISNLQTQADAQSLALKEMMLGKVE